METSGSMKSSIICPDPNSGIGSNGSPRIVRETAKKRQVSPSQTNQNPALISPYRLLSLPDRKSSRRKSGVCFSHFAWHEWLERNVRSDENRGLFRMTVIWSRSPSGL